MHAVSYVRQLEHDVRHAVTDVYINDQTRSQDQDIDQQSTFTESERGGERI